MTGRKSADRKQEGAVRRQMWVAGPMLSIGVILACLPAFHGCLGLGKPSGAVRRKRADNSPCMTCHMDFKKEPIALSHEKAGFGCTHCHGLSNDHGGDELNILPADKVYGRMEIVPLCKSCHPEHKKSRAFDNFKKKWQSRYRPNGRMITSGSHVCTDCHGNHAVISPDKLQFPTE